MEPATLARQATDGHPISDLCCGMPQNRHTSTYRQGPVRTLSRTNAWETYESVSNTAISATGPEYTLTVTLCDTVVVWLPFVRRMYAPDAYTGSARNAAMGLHNAHCEGRFCAGRFAAGWGSGVECRAHYGSHMQSWYRRMIRLAALSVDTARCRLMRLMQCAGQRGRQAKGATPAAVADPALCGDTATRLETWPVWSSAHTGRYLGVGVGSRAVRGKLGINHHGHVASSLVRDGAPPRVQSIHLHRSK